MRSSRRLAYPWRRDSGFTIAGLSKKTPKVIEITPLDGPAKGKPQKAIYQLKSDRLKLCVQNGDGKPPTEFATKAGDGLLLLIFERVKK